MAKRTVVWTHTAIKQRREILKYWAERNQSVIYSEKLIKLIDKQLKHIIDFPEIYRQADFPDVRVSAMGNYSIFYKLKRGLIIIVAFWDNRQDPKKLLQIIRSNKY